MSLVGWFGMSRDPQREESHDFSRVEDVKADDAVGHLWYLGGNLRYLNFRRAPSETTLSCSASGSLPGG